MTPQPVTAPRVRAVPPGQPLPPPVAPDSELDAPFQPMLTPDVDLPDHWAGSAVRWGVWRVEQEARLESAGVCPGCRTDAPHLRADATRAGQVVATAYRCSLCHLDTVLDHAQGTWWQLTSADYPGCGDRG